MRQCLVRADALSLLDRAVAPVDRFERPPLAQSHGAVPRLQPRAETCGLVSLDGFFSGFPLLTWIVLAIMADAGLFFGMPGLKGGTLLSGALLGILAWPCMSKRNSM